MVLLSSYFSEPLPPSIDSLLNQREKVRQRFPPSHRSPWRMSRRAVLFSTGDTALACFYRIYQFIVVDWNVALRNELEYFCIMNPDWAVADLPDPADTQDPARYAVLAGITYLLCEAFNRRIELGLPRDAPPIVEDWEELARRPKVLERVPAWAQRVPPLENVLRIPNSKGRYVEEGGPEVCEPFRKLNILMHQPHIHFV
ncbi:hypothetical protein OE88DRAFT_948755 [Heliocybe sulcata]|uniref:Uncharacterized protein n=1 Tax=Heliocybe sulcata TaxID=5364 RepID=A0A5C3NA69_9AGAM|nr:hypothetical protein OE88DRAFT_948755 [Heliocybe sulcata]